VDDFESSTNESVSNPTHQVRSKKGMKVKGN
jgi:hypothetical protein